MSKIQPITSLRDTAKLEKDLKENDGVLHITKNGYSDLVILSPEVYEDLVKSGPNAIRLRTNNEISSPKSNRFSPNKEQSDPYGYVRVRSESVPISISNVSKNAESIINIVKKARNDKVHILVLPELCLTGYTCSDLFRNDALLKNSLSAIETIANETSDCEVLFAFGAPIRKGNKIYNAAVVCHKGEVLGVVAKKNIPNYSEFYEARHFASWIGENTTISLMGKEVPFGNKILFRDEDYVSLNIGIEICEDLWVPDTPSTSLASRGATLILNLSGSNEVVGKAKYRRDLVSMTSGRLFAAYAYSDAATSESTTDLVYSSHNIIAENGKILAESKLFAMESATCDIDVEKILAERIRMTTYPNIQDDSYQTIGFSLPIEKPEKVLRRYNPLPFVPHGGVFDEERVETILKIQAMGLIKRLETVGQKKVLVGLSGGLDSTLALLVAVEAFDFLGYDRKGIKAVTLPAFGTSTRTHDNALLLSNELGVTFQEINLKESLLRHFEDIGHDPNNRNVTYENAQARERTQVLMDIANDEGSLMIGTGDLSELCLGWTTYSGDHMSMYGVNASIPKTLVRYLCEGYARIHPEASPSLLDIINTPISPELLPPDSSGEIKQQTEDIVGPYEVVDFIIYYFLRYEFRPKKIFMLLDMAYGEKYSKEQLKGWLSSFYRRFWRNQFKRSCLPDGPKVGTVAISPRGDWRMPSDASVDDYLKEIDDI